MTVRIFITLKKGVHDASGGVIENALRSLGFETVSNLRLGKYFELQLADGTTEDEIHEMCKQYLVNPSIEQYRIEVVQSN